MRSIWRRRGSSWAPRREDESTVPDDCHGIGSQIQSLSGNDFADTLRWPHSLAGRDGSCHEGRHDGIKGVVIVDALLVVAVP